MGVFTWARPALVGLMALGALRALVHLSPPDSLSQGVLLPLEMLIGVPTVWLLLVAARQILNSK
jgi:hypothetical protein